MSTRVASNCPQPVAYKVATEECEFEQIHRLNYLTFVEEIPQHEPNSAGTLVDRFHDKNTYFIALRDRELVGMLAFRDERPFSLDSKLPDLDSYLPTHRRMCEVRLLSTLPEGRNGMVLRGLVNALLEHVVSEGVDLAVISGTVRQAKLYEHLGFVPFGSVVGASNALYQPMYVTLDALRAQTRLFPAIAKSCPEPLVFLPGPVQLDDEVQNAMTAPPLSHRSAGFLTIFRRAQDRLCNLTSASNVQILAGSGTLANDVVAAQLSLRGDRGLVVSNGEFGERLCDHARRFRLPFRSLDFPWGDRLDFDRIAAEMQRNQARWFWAVHGETSTGVLNDLESLMDTASANGAELYLDTVSSLGNVPINMGEVTMASGVSGKGLGSCAGLAFVFHREVPKLSDSVPRYLDLGYYVEKGGVPFTVSSQLVLALDIALNRFDGIRHFNGIRTLHSELVSGLISLGLKIVGDSEALFPGVVTVEAPGGSTSREIGQKLESRHCFVNYESPYLVERNWFQISLMGSAHSKATIHRLLTELSCILADHNNRMESI